MHFNTVHFGINQKGAVAVIVGLCMILFISFAAISIDIGHLFVAKNELQNAADAGALAGAVILYDENLVFNAGAITRAYDAATDNLSENVKAEVNLTGDNSGDIQVGHYNPTTRYFAPTEGALPTTPIDLWNLPENYINAIKVTAHRADTPITSFFSKIFSPDDIQGSADAIAYLGFAGTLEPHDVDQPIAICRESLLDDDACNIGRMINSGNDAQTNETAGWTDFNQTDNPCSGTDANTLKSLVCQNGNENSIAIGEVMAFNNGEVQSAFNDLYQCWVEKSDNKTKLWELTLPVVKCTNDDISQTTCKQEVGAVTLHIVWITDGGEDPSYNNAPYQMDEWSNSNQDGEIRWADFVNTFHLQNQDGSAAPYAKKSIYFLPDCEPQYPRGNTGGENFGILARSPVLVE